MATVQEIWRYPVKSMAGESLERAHVFERGIPGDRAWAVRDETRGGIRGAKKIPLLMKQSSRYVSEPGTDGVIDAEITLTDGSTLLTSADDANERISSAVDYSVTLWPLQPAEELAHYRRGAPDHEDMVTELRETFGRKGDEPLPDFSVFPSELVEYESLPGTYFDAFPLLLCTTKSLATMQERYPDSQYVLERFRPNFLLDGEFDAPFPEKEWEGKRARLGGAVLEFTAECPRCVMITRETKGVPKDTGIMRALVKDNDGKMGIYATVAEPGDISIGDTLEFLT